MTHRFLVATAAALVVSMLCSLQAGAQIFTTRSDVEAEFRIQWLELKRNLPEYPDPRVQRYAACIAKAIIAEIPEEFHDLDWEVVVFDDESQNAMVTLFGKVAVFSGILQVADTPDKLAAVLGHEVSHLTLNHVSERVNRGRLTGLLGAAGGALTGIDSSGAAQVVVQLPFQRAQETEADISGMTYMARAGYNPAAAIELWRAMSAGDPRQRTVEWLSTHPDPEFRMTDIAKNLSPALVEYNNALDAGVRPRCSL